MSDITEVIRALCSSRYPDARGTVLPQAIDPVAMRGAFAAVLDGGISDMEIGALMAASMSFESPRTADMFAEIILGLSDAIRDRMSPLRFDASVTPVVVLPNYGDEDAYSGMPLVALLLRRMGIRVLVHGAVETYGGLLNCGVFREFGVLPAATRGQAERQLEEHNLALLPVTLFSPGLAAMLSLRNRLGIRTPAHLLAKMLMPVLDTSIRSLHVLYFAPWLRPLLADESIVLEQPALLVSTAEFNSGNLEDRAYFAFRDGENGLGWQTLFDSDCMPSRVENSPTEACGAIRGQHDPRAWAVWTRQRLDGKGGLPLMAANFLASCLYGCGYASDINQAKAIVAVEPGSLAA
jgi:anthranilate phosphoribosyltransferase